MAQPDEEDSFRKNSRTAEVRGGTERHSSNRDCELKSQSNGRDSGFALTRPALASIRSRTT
jgi:hypothetical protein